MLIKWCQDPSSLDVTTPHDSDAWNDRELATLLALAESKGWCMAQTTVAGSVSKHLYKQLHSHIAYSSTT